MQDDHNLHVDPQPQVADSDGDIFLLIIVIAIVIVIIIFIVIAIIVVKKGKGNNSFKKQDTFGKTDKGEQELKNVAVSRKSEMAKKEESDLEQSSI